VNEANRMTRIRSMLREKSAQGRLGVVAAMAGVGEGMLSTWLERPHLAPSRAELDAIEMALMPETAHSGA
jgi:hypothetical protein